LSRPFGPSETNCPKSQMGPMLSLGQISNSHFGFESAAERTAAE
jgi:hypothetical protein